MTNAWKVAAQPRWWRECAKEANVKMQADALFVNFQKKYKIPKPTFKILCGLAAMNGAEVAVKRLHAELNNPFPEEE